MRSKKKKLEIVPIVYDQNDLEEMNFQMLLDKATEGKKKQEEREWNLAELDTIANPDRIDKPEYEDLEVSDEKMDFWGEEERENQERKKQEERLGESLELEETRQRQDEEYEEYRKSTEREKERWEKIKNGENGENTNEVDEKEKKLNYAGARIFLIRGKGDRLEMQGLKRTLCVRDKKSGELEVWCELVANKTTRMEKRLEEAKRKNRWLPFLFEGLEVENEKMKGFYAWAKIKDALQARKKSGKRIRWISLTLKNENTNKT